MADTYSSSSHEQRVDAVIASYLEDLAAGKSPDRAALLVAQPDLAGDLNSFFADHDRMRQAARAASPTPDPRIVQTEGSGVLVSTVPIETPQAFGDYEALEEIARGGMGVVFKARQVSLNRVVALKMIAAGQLASAEDVQRFHAEAGAAAQLDHPNIVPIYEVGDFQGRPFFSMKLIEGNSLAALIKGQGASGEEQKRIVAILAQVARAVHYAHQRGILHRDLKPANILLSSGERESYVTDFGLARRVEGDSALTRTGAIVGTPSYMAPEQARASKGLTTAVDVYSLGAVLYESLTGQPPFRGESPLDTLLQVIEKEPPAPSGIRPGVDRDLETICLKCLDKDPRRRYDSAAALADDLERWLRDEPILARRTGTIERAVKWARRRPAVASLTALLLVVSLLGMAGIIWQWQVARASEAEAEERASSEAKEREKAVAAERKERDARIEKENALKREAEAHGKTRDAQNKAEAARAEEEKARVRADGLRLSAEASAVRHRDPALALLLSLEGVRRVSNGITWNVLYDALENAHEFRTLPDLKSGLKFVRFSPDGKHVLVAGTPPHYLTEAQDGKSGGGALWLDAHSDKVIGVWRSYGLPPTSLALSPDGKVAAVSGAGHANVYFSDKPEHEMMVFSDRVTYLFDPANGKDLIHLNKHRDQVVSVRFSPDGKKLVTASWDHTARLWETSSGKLLHILKGHRCSLIDAMFSPDGKQVLTVTSGTEFGGESYLWSIQEEKDPKKTPKYRDPGIVNRPRMFGEYGWMQAGSDFRGESPVARIFDAQTGKTTALCQRTLPNPIQITGKPSLMLLLFWLLGESLPAEFKGHAGHPKSAAFSPNGKLVAVAFKEHLACIWDAQKGGRERFVLKGHEGEVNAVAFSPDGTLLATAGADRTVRLWSSASGRELLRLRGHTASVLSVQFSRDGRLLLTTSDDRSARLWDTTSGEERAAFKGNQSAVISADLSPDGRQVVTSDGSALRIWQVAAPRPPAQLFHGHSGTLHALEFTPDSKQLLTAGPDETPKLWNALTGQEVLAIGRDKHLGQVHASHLSSDGKFVLTASENSQVSDQGAIINASAVHLWDAKAGQDVLALTEHVQGAQFARLSPDGATLLTITDGSVRKKQLGDTKLDVTTGNTLHAGILRLWDAKTGKLRATVEGTMQAGFAPRISPDGKAILVQFEHAHNVQVIDAATGMVRRTLGRERFGWGGHFQAEFHPDSKRVVTSTDGRTVSLWNIENGHLLAVFKGFEDQRGVRLAFSRDGKRLAIVAGQAAHVWDVETRERINSLKGHEGNLTAVVFSPDGQALLTGSEDRTAALWDIVTGKMLALYRGHAGPVERLAFSPDGQRVATSTTDGSARIWPVDLLPIITKRASRDFTAEERARYEIADPNAKPPPRATEPALTVIPPAGGPAESLASHAVRIDPATRAEADRKLEALKTRIEDSGADVEPIRQELLSMQRELAGSAPALKAASLLTRLPSPLDRLDPERIPAAERHAGQPKELVAVLGESRLKHAGNISKVLVSRDGKLAISGDSSTVHLWDVATLVPRGSIAGHLLGLTATGELATASGNKMQFWDVSQLPPKEVRVVAYPFDSKTALSHDGKQAATVSREGKHVGVWDLTRDRAVRHAVLEGPMHIEVLLYSPDGKRLVAKGQGPEVQVWRLDAPPAPPRGLKARKGWASGMAFSPEGSILAVGNGERLVQLWDVGPDEPHEKLSFEIKGESKTDTARRLAFSADGKMLAISTGEGGLELWDLSGTPRLLAQQEGQGWAMESLCCTPDGRTVFGGQHTRLRSWEATEDKLKDRAPPRGHVASPGSLDFSPDGRWLLSAGGEDLGILWDLSGNEPVETCRLPKIGWRALFAPDGKSFVAGTQEPTLWDLSGAKPRQQTQLGRHWYGPVGMAFSADGKLFASGSQSPTLRLWEMGGEKSRMRTELAEKDGGASANHLAFSPDGRLIAAGQHWGSRKLRLWRVEATGVRELKLLPIEAQQVAFAPDGRTLALSQDRAIHLLDLSSPVPLVRDTLLVGDIDEMGGVIDLHFSRDGKQLLGVGPGHDLVLWDPAKATKLRQWKFPGEVSAAALAPDGRHLAVGLSDGRINVLRLAR
jgi:WD40 repeat protein